MHKIDGPGATVANEWTEGNPTAGVPRTTYTSKFANTIQRELVNLVEASGISLDDQDDAQILESIRLLFGAGQRNQLINGGFGLFQRAQNAVVAAAGYHSSDRWYLEPGDAASNPVVGAQGFTFGQTDVPGNPEWMGFWNHVGATTSTPAYIEQRIENVRTLNGQSTVTVTAWARVQAGTLSVTPRLIQHFGTGGGQSPDVIMTAGPSVWTTTWTKFVYTFNVPTIAGKTLGTPPNWLAFRLEWPHGTTFIAEYAQIQLELGNASTAFEKRSLQEEFLLAARYFQKSWAIATGIASSSTEGVSTAWGGASSLDGIAGLARPLVVPMYPLWNAGVPGPPDMTWYDGSTVDQIEWNGNRVVTGTALASDRSTGYPVITTSSGSNALATAHWTADAEL